jgi:FAD:protein FMN transferase
MEALVHAQERRFTRFSPDSELSALNRAAGQWVEVSTDMYTVLRLARQYFYDTDGLFDPAILPALERVGYDRSIERVRAEGAAPAQPGAAKTRPSFGEMELADQGFAVHLPAGLRIDLGGIAKGWIAEQAARLLNRYAPACAVNAGGDQFTCGLPAGEPGWAVAIEDPFHPEADLTALTVGQCAVVTSSVIKRRWKQGEAERHHLIDPRSGLPAESPWASVTVVADSAAQAEVLAKALLIAGEPGAAALLARHPAAACITVDFQGRLWGSENSKEYLYGKHQPVY